MYNRVPSPVSWLVAVMVGVGILLPGYRFFKAREFEAVKEL